MFPLFIKASDNFCEVLEESAKSNSVVDVKELSKRYTIEVVLSVVFGIESNFIKNPKSTVGTMAADILKPNYITTIKLFLSIFIPDIARILKVCKCEIEN